MKIAVVGAGECFREKMVPALEKLPELEIAEIIDMKSFPQIEEEFRRSGKVFPNAEYIQIDGTPEDLEQSLHEDLDAVVLATPHNQHINQSEVVISKGLHLYVEKPHAIDLVELERFRQVTTRHSGVVYPACYYRDEKALALSVLTGHIRPGDFRTDFIQTSDGNRVPKEFFGMIDRLGKIRKIEGSILESIGYAGTLEQYLWNCHDWAGMYRDLFFHLATLVNLLQPRLGKTNVEYAEAGFAEEAVKMYEKEFGEGPKGETYGQAKFSTESGTEIQLSVGKYAREHKRNLRIEGESGFVHLDFNTNTATIRTPESERILVSWADPKYLFMMSTFYQLLHQGKPVSKYMLENSESAIRMALDARNKVSRSFEYRRGDV